MSIQDKNKTILHIGYPKTGTTWFQKNYFPFVKNAVFISNRKIKTLLGSNNNRFPEELVIKKVSELKQKGRLIISAESLVGKPQIMQQSATYYKNVFGSATIIIFIRNQVQKYASIYSEYIKAGGVKKLENFLINTEGELHAGEKHCYDKTLAIYQSVFGKDNVKVYLYEDFADDIKGFVNDFTIENNIDIDLKSLKYKRVNKSLSPNLMNIKRLTNKFTKKKTGWRNLDPSGKAYIFHIPYWYEFTYVVFKLLSKLNNQSKEILTSEQNDFLAAYFKKSNQRLIDEFGITDIKKYGYPL